MTWDNKKHSISKSFLLYNVLTGEEKGPFTENEAKAEIRRFSAGTLRDWFAWTEGLSDWKAIDDISELRPSVMPPPRPKMGELKATQEKPIEKSKIDLKTDKIVKGEGVLAAPVSTEIDLSEASALNLTLSKSREVDLAPKPIEAKSDHQQEYESQIVHWSHLGEAPNTISPALVQAIQPIAPKVEVVPQVNAMAPIRTSMADKRKHHRVPMKLKVVLIANDKTFRTFTEDVSLGGLRLVAEVPSDFLVDDCVVLISKIDDSENLMFEALPVVTQQKSGTRLKFDGEPNVYMEKLKRWMESKPKAQAA